jgi:hypothetical protein
MVEWKRGVRVQSTTKVAVDMSKFSSGGKVTINFPDEELQMMATLHKLEDNTGFKEKEYKFTLQEVRGQIVTLHPPLPLGTPSFHPQLLTVCCSHCSRRIVKRPSSLWPRQRSTWQSLWTCRVPTTRIPSLSP